MAIAAQWIIGSTRSGKTEHLLGQVSRWITDQILQPQPGQVVLIFAANGDNRIDLANRLATGLESQFPVLTTTPAGFIQDEVQLFWPLLVEKLSLTAQFPIRLRPENEQELAAQFWQAEIDQGRFDVQGWQSSQLVRRCLDFLQLAATAGIPAEDLAVLLPEGIPPGFAVHEVWQHIGRSLVAWRDWCLDRGLVTYGIMGELYWRYLLPHPTYQQKLPQRFSAILADDLDEYPGVTEQWFTQFLEQGLPCGFTWNPQGKVRLGVGADPARLATLANHCEVIELPPFNNSLAYDWGNLFVEWVQDPLAIPELPPAIQSLQTTSRGELLRQTAEAIAAEIEAGQIAAAEVAIIAPGLDAIARYTLAEILTSRGIPVASLNDQRSLVSSPLIRALLTLLPFIYPGTGELVDRDSVAEMLVVLSQTPQLNQDLPWYDTTQIDPVRAELIVDHCFAPDFQQPQLLPVEEFPRWDRLGYRATDAYNGIRDWIALQQQQRQQRLLPNVLSLLDRAIQQFFWRGSNLPYDQLAAMREFMETAQHYWEISDRLLQVERSRGAHTDTATGSHLHPIGGFIRLLRQGTVTANPYPVKPADPNRQGVTIATVFQYRSQRCCHRWQYWLDAGSPRWLTGTDALFGFPLFLSTYRGRPWTAIDIETLHTERLERILQDLLGRATERVMLCHSDLAVNGQEQVGPLLSLVNAAEVEVETPLPAI